ncbi:MAG: DUF2884 family protein [Calditrichaceae bacterium]|nr:DUF2884 family protein [Calditrichaceae bacterium]
MRVYLLSFIILSVIATSIYGVDYKKKKDHEHNFSVLDNVEIDIEDDSIILMDKDCRDEVEITGEYDLYVNGKEIELNNDQRKLVKEYYEMYFEIIDYAKRIGLEGARLGVEGAAIGVKAVAGVFKMLSADYDSEDLEAELEEKAEELEKKAEVLEDRAEDIEAMAEELEDLHFALAEKIEALGDLEMFR